MSNETLTLNLTKVEPATTKTGKNLHKAWDAEYYSSGYPNWSIWDADVAATLQALVGQAVTVSVSRDNPDFPAIKKFIKAGGADSAAATPPSQPTTSGQGTPARAAASAQATGSGGNTMKRDPLGVMLNLRQTALNCATQWMVSHNEKLPAEDKLGTTHLMKCADVLFRHLVRGVEDSLPIPQPGPETKVTEPGPGGIPDDDIPF